MIQFQCPVAAIAAGDEAHARKQEDARRELDANEVCCRVATIEQVPVPAGMVGQAEEGPMNTGLAAAFLHFGRRCSIFQSHG